MELTFCLTECEAMISKGSSTFHKAFGFLPSPRKEAVYVIYAFCRMIDDAVDEPESSPFTIDELEKRLEHLEEAEGHFIWPALRWLFASFPITKAPFRKQIEGQRRDLSMTHYKTMAELEEYCYLVAGTVGEMLLPVLHDHPSEDVVRSGMVLGKAMQIVNIVRDVGEDRARGRRYLPLDWMVRCGYSEEEFAAGAVNPAFIRLIHELDSLARGWFEEGLRCLDSYPPLSAFSVELASRSYEAILDAVKGIQYRVFTERAYVRLPQKLALLASLARRYGQAAVAEEIAVS